jgi:NitT/TauT family transport system permease protein
MHDESSAIPGWMRIALPSTGLLLFLVVWQALAQAVDKPSLLPTPVHTFSTLWSWAMGGGLVPHLWATVQGGLGGLAIGAGLGLLFGILVGEVPLLDRMLYPVALALQAMPVVAIAPLVIVWFGIGIASKVALVAIGTFFVMFINVVAGMHASPPELTSMARAFGGSRRQIALQIKLPNTLDYVFGALEVCAALSFILCVVGEFLAAQAGLGYYLRAASDNIDAASMFAALIVLSLLATALALVVRATHHRAVFWKYRNR